MKCNSYLLEELEKKPVEIFNLFKQCLVETGQGFFVTELLGDSGK